MKSTDAPEFLRPYIFHGIDLVHGDLQSTSDCPFCDASNKFSVKTETGQFRCLRCEETGNAYSFLFRLHQLSTEGTTKKDYLELSKLWGCSPAALQHFGICKSRITGDWLQPAYNTDGNLANLYRMVARKDEVGKTKLAAMSTPGCKPHPFGTNQLIKANKPIVWMVEGLKDGCVLWDAIIGTADNDTIGNQDVLPVPGCGNTSADWLELVAGKQLNICFDNDHPKMYGPDHEKAGQQITKRDGTLTRPGWDGMERVVKQIGASKHRPKKVYVTLWNGPDGEQGHNHNLPDGFDVADLFKQMGSSKSLCKGFPKPWAGKSPLEILNLNLVEAKPLSPKKAAKEEKDVPAIEPIHCDNFEDLCKAWASVLHFTQQLRDTLAIMLSVVLSTESEKVNHLWLRVIGPPGSGKSTLAEAISVAREWVSPKSIITGFHSGFVDPNADEPQTASLIPELDNKTVIMKDGDTLANSPGRDKILSELRDLYDGTSRAHYRNMKADEFEDVRLSFILCGTDELRQLNRSFLGERFIDCEIMARGEDTTPYLERAANNTYSSLAGFLSPKESDEAVPTDRMMYLKQITYGFIKFLKENYRTFTPPAINATTLNRLQAMGEYVALMRARVRHDHSEGSFRPRAELPTRLTSIFTKLAFFTAVTLRKATIDEEALRLVLKVVHDTSIGTQQELTEALAADTQSLGVSVRQMTLSLNLPETSTRRQLSDMRQFGIAQPYLANNNSGQRGRDRHLWVLTPLMHDLWSRVFNPHVPEAHTKPSKETKNDNRHTGSKRIRKDLGSKKSPKPIPRKGSDGSRARK